MAEGQGNGSARGVGVARGLELVLGLVFLLSALGKAMDIVAFAGEIHSYQLLPVSMLKGASVVIVGLELALAIALLVGFVRRATLLVSQGLLVGFTGLLFYAWIGLGLESCGCFGASFQLPMWASIAKNFVLIGIGVYPLMVRLREGDGDAALPCSTRAALTFGVSIALSVGLAMGMKKSTPTPAPTHAPRIATPANPVLEPPTTGGGEGDSEQVEDTAPEAVTAAAVEPSAPDTTFGRFVVEADGETWDLGQGTYMVAFFNATCEHCIAAVPEINLYPSYFPELPPIISLMQGSPQEREEFVAETMPEFPTALIEDFTFFEFIGSAPPRIYIIRDGEELIHWDGVPDEVELATFLAEM